jgi:hypothetical protein
VLERKEDYLFWYRDCISRCGRSLKEDICRMIEGSWSCMVCWDVGVVVRTTQGPIVYSYEGIYTSLV